MSQASYNPYAMRGMFQPQSQFITCFIQDGKIMSWAADGTQHVGWTVKAYGDLQGERDTLFERTQEYYEALSKNGECPNCGGVVPAVIAPELTQEQIIEKQAAQLAETQAALETNNKTLQLVLEELQALKGGNSDGIPGTVQHGHVDSNGAVETKPAGKTKGLGPGKKASGDK